MHAYEQLLHEAGLTLAIQPLREMFSYEGVDDPLLQTALTREVIARTTEALATLTRPKTLALAILQSRTLHL